MLCLHFVVVYNIRCSFLQFMISFKTCAFSPFSPSFLPFYLDLLLLLTSVRAFPHFWSFWLSILTLYNSCFIASFVWKSCTSYTTKLPQVSKSNLPFPFIIPAPRVPIMSSKSSGQLPTLALKLPINNNNNIITFCLFRFLSVPFSFFCRCTKVINVNHFLFNFLFSRGIFLMNF